MRSLRSGRETTVHHCGVDALGAEHQIVSRFVLEPEWLAFAHLEEDAALELEGRAPPAGAERYFAVLGRQSNEHRWNQAPQRRPRVVHHRATVMRALAKSNVAPGTGDQVKRPAPATGG